MSSGNFSMYNNVELYIIDKKEHRFKKKIEKHNKASATLIQGVLRFLRGEFNPSNVSEGLVNHNSEGAKIYIPSYISFGSGGITDGHYDEVLNASYYDTMLQDELINDMYGRIPISKSELGSSTPGDSGQLTLTTYVPMGYYYNIRNYNGMALLTECGLFSSDYDGVTDTLGNSNAGKMLARVTFDEGEVEQGPDDVILVKWHIGAVSVDDDIYYKNKQTTEGNSWIL